MCLQLKDKNIQLNIQKTDSKLGLINDDVWCEIFFSIKNTDIEFEQKGNFLTKKEILRALDKIENFYNNPIKNLEISFIKNFYKLRLKNHNNKTLEIVFVKVIQNKKDYKISLKDKEILDFIKVIRNFNLENL